MTDTDEVDGDRAARIARVRRRVDDLARQQAELEQRAQREQARLAEAQQALAALEAQGLPRLSVAQALGRTLALCVALGAIMAGVSLSLHHTYLQVCFVDGRRMLARRAELSRLPRLLGYDVARLRVRRGCITVDLRHSVGVEGRRRFVAALEQLRRLRPVASALRFRIAAPSAARAASVYQVGLAVAKGRAELLSDAFETRCVWEVPLELGSLTKAVRGTHRWGGGRVVAIGKELARLGTTARLRVPAIGDASLLWTFSKHKETSRLAPYERIACRQQILDEADDTFRAHILFPESAGRIATIEVDTRVFDF